MWSSHLDCCGCSDDSVEDLRLNWGKLWKSETCYLSKEARNDGLCLQKVFQLWFIGDHESCFKPCLWHCQFSFSSQFPYIYDIIKSSGERKHEIEGEGHLLSQSKVAQAKPVWMGDGGWGKLECELWKAASNLCFLCFRCFHGKNCFIKFQKWLKAVQTENHFDYLFRKSESHRASCHV